MSSDASAPIESSDPVRDAICDALVSLIDERGYSNVELDQVLESADVDLVTFQQHFESLDHCFVEIWTVKAQYLASRVLAVYGEAGNWRDGIRAQAWELCRLVVEDELRARICMVEVNFGGDLVQATRDIIMGGYVELIHLGRNEVEGGESIPKARAEAAVGAIWERVGSTIMSGRLDSLPGDVPGLLFLAYLPYLGPDGAAAEMRRAEEDLVRYRRGEI